MTATASATDPTAGLHPVLAQQVQGLLKASQGSVRLVSGYRSAAQQQKLVEEAARLYGPQNVGQWVAPPDASNHVAGAAVDLAGDLTAAHQLAPQFGLHAPMAWEPHHFELASTPTHAQPAAYTTPPPGEQNPTVADKSQNPGYVAASMAEGLLGMNNNVLGTAGATGDALQQILNTVPATDQTTAASTSGGLPAGAGGGSTTSLGGANVPAGKGNVSPNQLYGALTAAGLPPTAAAAFVSIAGRESGYNTGAFNGNTSTGDQSYGLFQINLLHGGWAPFLEAHGMSDPATQLTTLQGSVQAAKAIYDASGLHPWGGYKGMPWWYSTNLQAGADASGGAVTTADMQALGGG